MSSPITQSNEPVKPLQVSSNVLSRSDALRASIGLPPLEVEEKVQVVKGEQSLPVTRQQLAEKQGSLQPSEDNEASSFLKFPSVPDFIAKPLGISQPAKITSSKVPSTTIVDALQFIPIGTGIGLATKGANALIDVGKSEAKTVSKEGSKDIGLFVKESNDYLNAKRFTSQTRTLPKPDSIRPSSSPPPKPNVKSGGDPFKSTNVNLGTGIGRMVNINEKGANTDKSIPKPPNNPSNDPFKSSGEREIKSGKGLVQLIKEKPEIKPNQQKSTFKQYPISLGRTKTQIVKPKILTQTKAQLETERYLKTLQERKFKVKQRTDQQQITIFETPQKTKQTQIVSTIPKQTTKQTNPFATITNTKQTQPQLHKQPQPQKMKIPNPLIPRNTPNIPKPKNPPNKPQPKPPEIPPSKKKLIPIFPVGKSNPLNGGGSSISGSGTKKSYIGNVPQFSFTGMYNRSETIYGKVKTPKIKSGKSLSSKLNKII